MYNTTFLFLSMIAAFGFHIVDLILFFGALVWIAMLIDCLLFNTKQSQQQKIYWILALALIAPIGTLLYFFGVFLGRILIPQKPQPTQSQMHHSPYAQTQENYSEYAQGYQQEKQAVQPIQSIYQPTLDSEQTQQSSAYPLYEQPQASYPEITE